ncbi:hypothetical protein ON010_g13162 [Phytophthora cinnamomi]|nr:hypothetical protein ON010_g13162 [Phytophthora cinnamomi]
MSPGVIVARKAGASALRRHLQYETGYLQIAATCPQHLPDVNRQTNVHAKRGSARKLSLLQVFVSASRHNPFAGDRFTMPVIPAVAMTEDRSRSVENCAGLDIDGQM